MNDRTSHIEYLTNDVFVASVLIDEFGETLAESMVWGAPVVCFDATGPKHIFAYNQTACRAGPDEPSDLAAGLERALAQYTVGVERLRHQSPI